MVPFMGIEPTTSSLPRKRNYPCAKTASRYYILLEFNFNKKKNKLDIEVFF